MPEAREAKILWLVDEEGVDTPDTPTSTPASASEPLPVRLYGQDPVPAVSELWISPWVQVPYGATSGAIDANDALGNRFKFTSSEDGRPLPRKGTIVGIKMRDLDNDTLAATIHIFNAPFSAAASDAAYTIGLADAEKHVADELFPGGTSNGTFKAHDLKDVDVDYFSPLQELHAQLSSTGTPNIASAQTMPLVQLVIVPRA